MNHEFIISNCIRQLWDKGNYFNDCRYKAMFALRNAGDEKSIKALASGLTDSSALFRHEVAFVLGQVASPHAAAELTARLRDENESPMVRHEVRRF